MALDGLDQPQPLEKASGRNAIILKVIGTTELGVRRTEKLSSRTAYIDLFTIPERLVRFAATKQVPLTAG